MRTSATPPLLPPPVRGWPAVLRPGAPADVVGRPDDSAAAAALVRIDAETLWWPAPRAGARRARVAAFGAAGLAAARARHDDAAIARVADPAAIDPEALEAVFGAPAEIALWARLGGRSVDGAPPEPEAARIARLAGARATCPWRGEPISLGAAIEAQSLLRAAAMRARGPARLVGMSAWKRGCLRPFLTGPDGPARRARQGAAAGPRVVWGAAEGAADLRAEDGFLRSVGLGVRHAPPASLILTPERLHFDARGPNGFETLARTAEFTPALRARAAALRARVLALRLTKYNLAGPAAPPDLPAPEGGGRMRLLVPGQVESDASIRFGAGRVRTNEALIRAARARFPDAFLLYKPHPDVIRGRRAGAIAAQAAEAAGADAVAAEADAAACLDWADRVATMTSLMGFEALLRGKAVTTFGRPFYAGWGLTDDVEAPPRGRTLDLDALTAAALILYPDYVDPRTRLPAPPEIVVEALARERDSAGSPRARLRAAWRAAASWALTRL